MACKDVYATALTGVCQVSHREPSGTPLRGRRTGVTAEMLAERYGVSVRTIYRDLDTLRDAALPVRADRGRGGGYALDKSYALPPVALSAREAALLVRLGEHAIEMRLVP